jgi:hypothetical protein
MIGLLPSANWCIFAAFRYMTEYYNKNVKHVIIFLSVPAITVSGVEVTSIKQVTGTDMPPQNNESKLYIEDIELVQVQY